MSFLDPIEAAAAPYLIWIKIGLAVLAAAVISGATFYVTHNIDKAQLEAVQLADSKAQTANISASLLQLEKFISKMDTADANYNAQLTAIKTQFANISQELSNALRTPLPADCKPTADRLRVLSDAVSAANQGPAAHQ